MALACHTGNVLNPRDSRPHRQGASAANLMPGVRATPCAVRTDGVATLLVLAAVITATPYSNGTRVWEPERSFDLSTDLAVNEDSDGGAVEVLPWVTDHGNQVACE